MQRIHTRALLALVAFASIGAAAVRQDTIEEIGLALRKAIVAEAGAEESYKTEANEARVAREIARHEQNEAITAANVLEAARALRAELEEQYREAILANPGEPGPDPVDPPPPDPGPDPDPNALKLNEYIATLPFADELPPFPRYVIPTEADCDYVYSGSGLRPGAAYRAWLDDGGTGIWTLGIKGNAGNVHVGFGYGHLSGDTISGPSKVNKHDVEVAIVGLTPDAEMLLTIGEQWAEIERAEFYNIGCRGTSAAFIVSAQSDNALGDIVFDGCWWLNRADWQPGEYVPHTSGIHLTDHRSLIFRRHKFKGWAGREHCLYDKSSTVGPTWIVECDLRGGGRTGFQRRPAPSHNARPAGPYIVLLNTCESASWSHDVTDGGSTLSFWTAPEDTIYVAGNEITDARHGCLMFGAQPASQGNWLNADGYPIKRAWVWDNTFTNPRGSRSAISISSVQELHFGPNVIGAGDDFVLDGRWNAEVAGDIRNGSVTLYGSQYTDQPIETWRNGRSERLTAAEKAAMIQPVPVVD